MKVTVKNLQKHFQIAKEDAENIVAQIEGRATPGLTRRTMRWDDLLDYANRSIGGHGIEVVRGTKGPEARYEDYTVMAFVNMGDSYTMTIVYDLIDRKYEMTDLGTWLVKHGESKKYGIKAYEDGER